MESLETISWVLRSGAGRRNSGGPSDPGRDGGLRRAESAAAVTAGLAVSRGMDDPVPADGHQHGAGLAAGLGLSETAGAGALNFLWTLLFFNLQLRLTAFFWLLALLGVVGWMVSQMERVDRTAAGLQIPYLIWLVFAGYLNFGVYLLNR